MGRGGGRHRLQRRHHDRRGRRAARPLPQDPALRADGEGEFHPRGGYCLFDLEGVKCALLICYDVEFAPHLRALAAAGAELVLVPTANPRGFEHVQDFLVPARAAELGLIVAYANFCGEDAGLGFCGRSLIAGPDGRALAAAGPGETLLITDLGAAALVPAAHRSTQLSDLRSISDDA
nr:nitrilase-related carbon-nitrogen hydrolase [Rhodobacter xanthinilyticus]